VGWLSESKLQNGAVGWEANSAGCVADQWPLITRGCRRLHAPLGLRRLGFAQLQRTVQ